MGLEKNVFHIKLSACVEGRTRKGRRWMHVVNRSSSYVGTVCFLLNSSFSIGRWYCIPSGTKPIKYPWVEQTIHSLINSTWNKSKNIFICYALIPILQKTPLFSLCFTRQGTCYWQKVVPEGWILPSTPAACCCGTWCHWKYSLISYRWLNLRRGEKSRGI